MTRMFGFLEELLDFRGMDCSLLNRCEFSL